jgi:hypothetical protein
MKNLILILSFLTVSTCLSGQTPVSSIEIDTAYLVGNLNGRNVIFKASEFLSAGGATDDQTLAEVLSSGNTANIAIDMDGNNVNNVGNLTFDATNDWVLNGNGASLEYTVLGTERFALSATGVPTINNAYALPNIDGADGQVQVTNGAGTLSWTDLSSGGGGGGSGIYLFGGYSTQTATITQDVWTDITINTEINKDASFTHSAASAETTLDSTGLYLISVTSSLDPGSNRADGSLRIRRDIGSGYVDLPGGMGYVSFGTEPFASVAIQVRGVSISNIMYSATAGHKIKAQVYNDSFGDWTFTSGSSMTIMRVK